MQEHITATDVQKALIKNKNPEKGAFLQRFFKTAKGEYAEGDKFRGLTVPQTRVVVKQYKALPLSEVIKLLHSEWHDDRLCALLIMVEQSKKADDVTRKKLYDAYLAHTKYINNWDLVDCSASYIVGKYLEDKPLGILKKLAKSDMLFERRIAMLATFPFIKKGTPEETFTIADMLMQDKQDLIHKAVGWLLREVGKSCSHEVLEKYLKPRYKTMPRTMLRYAIEHFPPTTRQRYLKGEM